MKFHVLMEVEWEPDEDWDSDKKEFYIAHKQSIPTLADLKEALEYSRDCFAGGSGMEMLQKMTYSLAEAKVVSFDMTEDSV